MLFWFLLKIIKFWLVTWGYVWVNKVNYLSLIEQLKMNARLPDMTLYGSFRCYYSIPPFHQKKNKKKPQNPQKIKFKV